MTQENNSAWYDRPDAVATADGQLEIRASAARSCRRALWYSICEAEKTNPPQRKDTARMEAGKMLEPILVHLMVSEGWTIRHNTQVNPETCRIRLMPGVIVTGTYDAMGKPPESPATARESVIEVKTRGQSQYTNWSLRGARLATPEAVAQGAIYVCHMDPDGELIIATMNRETMEWDTETIPNRSVRQALMDTVAWLAPLQQHYQTTELTAELAPERDFTMKNYQCQNCPYQKTCYQDQEEELLPEDENVHLISIEDATQALLDYEDAAKAENKSKEKKADSMAVIAAWYTQNGEGKLRLRGHEKERTVSRISYPDYKVSHKAIRELLTDEQKEEHITEGQVNYVRVS